MSTYDHAARLRLFLLAAAIVLTALMVLFPPAGSAQGNAAARPAAAPGLDLSQGMMTFHTPDFTLALVRSSQTAAALQPRSAKDFDFTPSDRLSVRLANGYHHLGDLILQLRTSAAGPWKEYSTSNTRRPVLPLPAAWPTLAEADLRPTLPADCPLQVIRAWALENGRLVLRFTLRNKGTQPVEIGGLAVPMVFNNILTDRTLEQAHAVCSFSDPYIGQDGGYLQVTRLNGQGPVLLVVPSNAHTPFEGYEPLDEPMPRSQTFEGMLAWVVHSRAYADTEWSQAQPWNAPTEAHLAPGQSQEYAFKFLLADGVRRIDAALATARRPVAIGIPGYVLPQDQDGRLFLKYPRPVRSFTVSPPGALIVSAHGTARHGWRAYAVQGRGWGRARLTVRYDDGLAQTISYDVIKPAAQAVSDLGHFLTTRQWFVDPSDPFGRSPSIISYDREANRQVTQESRVWIAGLSDEAGAGSYVAEAMKLLGQPKQAEITKFDQFVDHVLWGGIQNKSGPDRYGVRKSLFYYDPAALPDYPYRKDIDWTSWTSWNKAASEDIGRGYNYPHVVIAYWAMYRVARNHPGIVTAHPWQWYLNQAYQTTRFLFSRDASGQRRVGYVELGLMEGDVFLALLQDLQHEGWTTQAAAVRALMKERADRWKGMTYPFGSEMAWDSTGQEEVYAWSNYFGNRTQAVETLDAILGYMPTLPHWGYNGSARRYWDFLYGGKLPRIERQLQHYGSGLNAIPVLRAYRSHPDDFYLLQVGYGGTMGPLANIDREGFASAAFHSYPSTLKWDAYSGDYGPNFFGHAFNTATYVIDHPDFGWQAYGGNVTTGADWVKVVPRDSFRQRLYIAPFGLWLTLDTGTFTALEISRHQPLVRIALSPADRVTPQALLRIAQPARRLGVGVFIPRPRLSPLRGGVAIPLHTGLTWITLQAPNQAHGPQP